MAGWSLLEGGVFVEDNGVVAGEQYDRVRCRFEEFIVEFLSEIYAPNCYRPFPPMLGNGQRVDLYKLFMVVKGKGGYDAACNGQFWDLVGEETGLGVRVGSSAKLVYSKYLSAFDAWLKKGAENRVLSECGLVDYRDRFGKRLMELEAEMKGVLLNRVEDEVDREGFKGEFDNGRMLCGINEVKGFNLEANGDRVVRNGGCPESGMLDREMMSESAVGNMCEGNGDMEVLEEFDGGKMSAKPVVDLSDAVNSSMLGFLSGSENGDIGSTGCKRRRESVFDSLNWVTSVAKNPCDPGVGALPEKSKWKSYSDQEVWKQVLMFRKHVFLKRGSESSSENHSWQSQKMHPCLYDDNLGAAYNLRERLKHDKKQLFGKLTSAARSSSDSSVGSEGDLDRTPSPHTADRTEKQLLDSSDALPGTDRCPTIRIPLGPNHQAVVPEWTGMTSESDSKWLGTHIWPRERVSSRLIIERDPMGKGRQDSCGCAVPGSVECVRFHISEKRAKVKLELGEAFYKWNFDNVGEDVRRLWADQEEKIFKDVVQSNPPSSERYFWDHIFRTFPKKSRADLVSYYFNVFLLQRRGYQNRHTPDSIDSDDDESEFGPLRNVFGQQSRSSILLTPKKSQTKGK